MLLKHGEQKAEVSSNLDISLEYQQVMRVFILLSRMSANPLLRHGDVVLMAPGLESFLRRPVHINLN